MKANEIKFTKEGKKVVVIGSLNQSEYIVQEIYVTDDGDEIPSGDRFVTKTLLDAPVKTWQEREKERIKEDLDRAKKSYEKELEAIRKRGERILPAIRSRIKWLEGVAKESHPEALKNVISQLVMFLENKPMWFVCDNWQGIKIFEYTPDGMNDFLENYEKGSFSRGFEGLRLLSLFGKDDGTFQWRVNEYSDGSGNNSDFTVFKTKEEAISFIQCKADNMESYTSKIIKTADVYGIKLDKSKLSKYHECNLSNIDSNIKSYKDKIDKMILDKEEIIKTIESL